MTVWETTSTAESVIAVSAGVTRVAERRCRAAVVRCRMVRRPAACIRSHRGQHALRIHSPGCVLGCRARACTLLLRLGAGRSHDQPRRADSGWLRVRTFPPLHFQPLSSAQLSVVASERSPRSRSPLRMRVDAASTIKSLLTHTRRRSRTRLLLFNSPCSAQLSNPFPALDWLTVGHSPPRQYAPKEERELKTNRVDLKQTNPKRTSLAVCKRAVSRPPRLNLIRSPTRCATAIATAE